MNMPIDKEGRVAFTTTLFALIRDNLKINVRESAEMDQADLELRATIMKVCKMSSKCSEMIQH